MTVGIFCKKTVRMSVEPIVSDGNAKLFFKKCLISSDCLIFHASPYATSLGIPFSMQALVPFLWAFHFPCKPWYTSLGIPFSMQALVPLRWAFHFSCKPLCHFAGHSIFHASPSATLLGIPFSMQALVPLRWTFHFPCKP
jgi:hypothetical protein